MSDRRNHIAPRTDAQDKRKSNLESGTRFRSRTAVPGRWPSLRGK